jgi:hypothetical protein
VKIAAFVPDLLFGSQVVGMLPDHEVALVGRVEDLEGALTGARVFVVDLTADAQARIAAVSPRLSPEVRSLAFYSHVEADVRAAALDAGFELVVPRSRMAREGAALVASLIDG